MLELRPICERCEAPLPLDAPDARICSFECTFCGPCADGELGGRCPNCGGDLQRRPARAAGSEPSPAATARRYGDAWTAGDLTAVLDAYADDVVFHYFGASPLAGAHVGKAAALDALALATARTDRRLLEVVDVLGGSQLAALVVTEEVGPERTPIRRVLLYRCADDRLAECWLYDEDQRAIDELWADAGAVGEGGPVETPS
jgi:hypothetical protein